MGIIVSDPFSDLRGPKCGTAQKLTRFVNSQLRQVFYKGLPGLLLKNRRKIAAADTDLCGNRIERAIQSALSHPVCRQLL